MIPIDSLFGLDSYYLAGSGLRDHIVLCLVAQSCLTLCNPMSCQAPLSMGFPRQEYYSGLPFPFTGDTTDPGIEFAPPALAGKFFTPAPPGKSHLDCNNT